MRTTASIVAVGLIAGIANAQSFQFLSSDDATLYRGTNLGLDETFAGTDEIRGMSILENGVSLNGANAGDVIALSSPQNINENQTVYRVQNAFGGTPSLVSLGSIDLDFAVSDIAFANGRIFGVRNQGTGGTIIIHEFDTNFALLNTFDTGIQLINKGAGGLAYDPSTDLFYVTDPDSDKLWSYVLGGSASLIGDVGFDFGNNDLAMFNGRLYAGLADLPNNDYRIGEFNLTDGSFASIVTVGGYLGGAIGTVVVPSAPTLGLLGLAGLLGARRRR